MKVKTSELEGAALDWAVAQFDPMCEGLEWRKKENSPLWLGYATFDGKDEPCAHLKLSANIKEKMALLKGFVEGYSPSTDWSQGGPLIEQFIGNTAYEPDCPNGAFYAETRCDNLDAYANGSTPLVAACRAIVAAKLGDEVEVPDELLQ